MTGAAIFFPFLIFIFQIQFVFDIILYQFQRKADGC